MTTNSLGIIAARANAEFWEDRISIVLGDGMVAYSRRRRADAANKEAYEEHSRHTSAHATAVSGGR